MQEKLINQEINYHDWTGKQYCVQFNYWSNSVHRLRCCILRHWRSNAESKQLIRKCFEWLKTHFETFASKFQSIFMITSSISDWIESGSLCVCLSFSRCFWLNSTIMLRKNTHLWNLIRWKTNKLCCMYINIHHLSFRQIEWPTYNGYRQHLSKHFTDMCVCLSICERLNFKWSLNKAKTCLLSVKWWKFKRSDKNSSREMWFSKTTAIGIICYLYWHADLINKKIAIYDMVIFISDRIRNDYTSACYMYSLLAVFYKHYVILFIFSTFWF